MPLRTGFRKRRRFTGKRRFKYGNRKRNKWALTKSVNNHGMIFWKEKVYKTVTLTPSTAPGETNCFFGQMSFNIGDLGNIGYLSEMFDQYMIRGVQVKFYPVSTNQEVATDASTHSLMMMAHRIDYDDSGEDSQWATAMKSDSKIQSFRYPIKKYLQPKCLLKTYAGTVTTGYSVPDKQRWIDTENTTQPHFGLKYSIKHVPSPVARMDVILTYYVAFKGQTVA